MKKLGKQTANKDELAKYKLDQVRLKNDTKYEQLEQKKKELTKNDKMAAKMLRQKHATGDTKVMSR